MAENQNDNRNQQADSKSKQESAQDGNIKETSPVNTTANTAAKPGNLQQQDKKMNGSTTNTDVLEADEKEEATDETHGVKKTGDADATKSDGKTSNQNLSKGIL